jgi:hypothetical protein
MVKRVAGTPSAYIATIREESLKLTIIIKTKIPN